MANVKGKPLRSYLAWPFKALTVACVAVGVVSMLLAMLIEEGLQGRTLKEFIGETI